jgi:hypothetical protein
VKDVYAVGVSDRIENCNQRFCRFAAFAFFKVIGYFDGSYASTLIANRDLGEVNQDQQIIHDK